MSERKLGKQPKGAADTKNLNSPILDRQETTLKMEKIRAHLAEGEEQADRGEFSDATTKSTIKKGLKRNHAR